MARWCARRGARVTVADTREAPPQLAALREQLPQATSSPARSTRRCSTASADAGAPQPRPDAGAGRAGARCGARARHRRGRGELGLFARRWPPDGATHGYAPAVLAVTGTNGKTTVTALTGQLVERAGKTVAVAGNIGPTLLDTLARHIDAGSAAAGLGARAVQLPARWRATGFEPTARRRVLNLTQDHLDWHGDMQAYAAAKARVFGSTALMVLNREDAAGDEDAARAVRLKGGEVRAARYLTFGARHAAAARRLRHRSGQRHGLAGARARSRRDAASAARTRAEEIHIQRLMPADALRIRGRHNAVNALAALALAGAAGCPLGADAVRPARIPRRAAPGRAGRHRRRRRVLRRQQGHQRRRHGGRAAGPGRRAQAGRRSWAATARARTSRRWPTPVARYARAAVLIGRDAPLIRAVLRADRRARCWTPRSMEQAVRAGARSSAHAGDAVLMSPACASFDMFRNYPHRAEVFRAAVQALADEAGARAGGRTRMTPGRRCFAAVAAAWRARDVPVRLGRRAAARRRRRRGCRASTRRCCGSRWRCWPWAW